MPNIENPRHLNPVTLAFLGDSVFELYVRERIVREHGSMPPGRLHILAVRYVRANAQASLYDRIEPLLDEEEREVLRRGRNAANVTPPKNADPAAYRKATAVEVLLGYLHLLGLCERAEELMAHAFEA